MSFEHLLPIVTTLASEIIPDLVRGRGGLSERDSLVDETSASKMTSRCKHPQDGLLSAQELAAYAESCCRACLELSSEEVASFARNLFAQGLDIEVLYLDIIPPSIRLLHDWWESDQISFVEVTTATWNIKRLIFALSPDFIMPNESSIVPGSNRFQALVTSAAGSQHTLGPLIVSQYLQRKGWSVLPGFDHQEKVILELVAKNWVDLFCVSISLSSQVPTLKSWIAKVKSKSKNSAIQFLVGGPLIALHPELIEELGADLICKNVRDVHTLGMKLVSINRKARKINQLNAFELADTNYYSTEHSAGGEFGGPANLKRTSSTMGAPGGKAQRQRASKDVDSAGSHFQSPKSSKSRVLAL